MAHRKRRVHDDEPGAERRLVPARDGEVARSGPAGEVLRLQMLAGNTAVSGLMRSAAIQRDEGAAPAPVPTEEKPKESGIPVDFGDDDIGTVVALSVHHQPPRTIEGRPGDEKPPRKTREVVILRRMDDKSQLLMRRSLEGSAFPTVVIKFPSLSFVITDVVISSYSMSGGDEPMESLTLSGFEPEEKK